MVIIVHNLRQIGLRHVIPRAGYSGQSHFPCGLEMDLVEVGEFGRIGNPMGMIDDFLHLRFYQISYTETDTYYAIYPYAAPRTERRIPTDEDIRAAFGYDKYFMSKLLMYKEGGWQDDSGFSETVMTLSNDKRAIALAYLNNLPMQIKVKVHLNASNQLERVDFPAEQTVVAGQCACPNAMLMVARSTDAGTLQFKNVCAYVKLTPAFDCTAITVRSNTAQMMSGTVTVDYNSGAPTASITEDGTNTVTLSGDIAANVTYYIAVLPATLNNGFALTFKTPDGDYEKSTGKTLTLTRNHVTDLGSFTKTDLTISGR